MSIRKITFSIIVLSVLLASVAEENDNVKFSYCGLYYSDSKSSTPPTRLKWLDECTDQSKKHLTEMSIRIGICYEQLIYYHLVLLEGSFYADNHENFDYEIENIKNTISTCMGNLHVSQRSRMRIAENVAYSLERLLESRERQSSWITSDLVDGVLKSLGLENKSLQKSFLAPNIQVFWQMLWLATKIEKKLREGNVPSSLSDIASITDYTDPFGHEIQFLTSGETWVLYSSCNRWHGHHNLPFDIYPPAISTGTGRVVVQGVWLSSTYAKKRRKLFENGMLYEEHPQVTCRIENGMVCIGTNK